MLVLREGQTSEDWETKQSNDVSENGERWAARYLFTCVQGGRGVSWLRWLVAGVESRPVHMKFLLDRAALGQVSVYISGFPP